MPKILVAPGSGDIHWVMLKMESMIQKRWPCETPEVWVWCEAKSTRRSEGYVRRLPFVNWGGYFDATAHHAFGSQVFIRGKPWMVDDWEGFDLFIALNAPLGWGTPWKDILPKYETNWDYELKLEGDDHLYGAKVRAEHGNYVVVWFCGHSFYKGWLNTFTIAKILDLLGRIRDSGRKVVLTGAKWDIPWMRNLKDNGYVDLVGETTMGQLLGLMKHASAYVGFAAGQGMLAQHMGTKTFLLWRSNQWNSKFMTNWVDPAKNGSVYHALDIAAPCTPYILEKL